MDPSKQVRSLVPERVLLGVMILAVFVIIVGGNYAANPSSLIPGLEGGILEENIVTGAAANSGLGLGKVGYWMIGIGVIALFWVIFLLVYLIKKRKSIEEVPISDEIMPTVQPVQPAVVQAPSLSPEMAKVDEAISMLDKGMVPQEISLSTFKPLPKPKKKVKKKAEKPAMTVKRKVVKKRVVAPTKKTKTASKPRRVQDDLDRVDEAIAKAEREIRR